MKRSSVPTVLTLTISGLVLAAGLGRAEPSAASGAPQDTELVLAGNWALNDELSDDPRARAEERDDDGERRPGGRGGFGRGPGGFGGPGGGPGGFGGRGPGGFGGRGGFGGGPGGRDGERPDPERMAAVQEAMRELMAGARRMSIAGDRTEVVLTYGDGRVVRLIPDGREHAGIAGSAAQVKRTTQWNGETLEAEIELQARRKFTVRHSYEVQDGPDGGRQLIVTSQIEGGRRGGDRELRRVYDAVEP